MALPVWTLAQGLGYVSLGQLSAQIDPRRPDLGLQQVHWRGELISNATLLQLQIPFRPEVETPLEVYLRDEDLICSYPARKKDMVRHHVYYRAVEHEGHHGLLFLLSAQTSSLDSRPAMDVRNSFFDSDVLMHINGEGYQQMVWNDEFDALNDDQGPDFFIIRLANHPELSIVLMEHPDDFFLTLVECDEEDDGYDDEYEDDEVEESIDEPDDMDLDEVDDAIEDNDTSPGESQIVYTVFPDSLEKGVIRTVRFAVWFIERRDDQRVAGELFQQFCDTPLPLTT